MWSLESEDSILVIYLKRFLIRFIDSTTNLVSSFYLSVESKALDHYFASSIKHLSNSFRIFWKNLRLTA